MSKTKYEYYKDPHVEAFMINILEKIEDIKPVFDLQQGYRYPHVESAIKSDPEKTIAFLENLVQAEILDKHLHDMELRCPTCNSPNVSVNYVCPKCVSSHIRKTILLEHNVCGYIGTVINFGQPLLCPRCEQPIKENEYRDAGSIYECADCNQQIETPFIDHGCRKCGLKFSFENALYQPKYAYSPTKLTRVELNQGIIYLGHVVNVFEELGFIREVNTQVRGESGVEHVFDAAFSGFGMKVVVDIAYSMNPMNELDLLKKYSKIRDIHGAKRGVEPYLLVIPGLDVDAGALVKAYDMQVASGENPKIALAMLKATLLEKIDGLKKEKGGFSLWGKKEEAKKTVPTEAPSTPTEDSQSQTQSASTTRIKRVRVKRNRPNPSENE